MNSKNFFRFIIFVLLTALVFSLTACNTNQTANRSAKSSKTQNVQSKSTKANKAKSQKSQAKQPKANQAKSPGAKQSGKQTSHLYSTPPIKRKPLPMQISDKVTKTNGVQKATVIVHNNDIVVGLDTKGSNPTIVEENVRHQIKVNYPQYAVHVTSDQKLHAKIKKLNTKMNGAKPVKTLTKDIKTVIADIGKTVRAPFKK
ncbi:YhcN/YlaJ family sporulation lipoprotein [Paenibacillus sp. M1]|uniref:YhcN/YlaJ family sporulation lipoprotein n=1 Tax=Paenibacillus haidiansis TaxID=1574488 RepID=A0ABU7VYK5_9BACL